MFKKGLKKTEFFSQKLLFQVSSDKDHRIKCHYFDYDILFLSATFSKGIQRKRNKGETKGANCYPI